MVEKIVFEKEVIFYLQNLAKQLYKKEYFSYIEIADKYVDFIYDSILNNILQSKHIKTSAHLKKYGEHYFIIKTNKRTAWHIFFIKRNNIYLITNISNNHLPSANFLNDL